MKPKIKPTTRQDELMRAFNFNEDDLEANREGRISNTHGQKILERERKQWQYPMYSGCFIALLPMIGMAIIVSPVLLLSLNAHIKDFAPLALVFAPIAFIGLNMLHHGYLKRKSIKSDIDLKQVEALQGIAVVDIGERERKPKLTISDYQFDVPRNALLRIKHLEPHIVYFLPRSKIIVSVEVVES